MNWDELPLSKEQSTVVALVVGVVLVSALAPTVLAPGSDAGQPDDANSGTVYTQTEGDVADEVSTDGSEESVTVPSTDDLAIVPDSHSQVSADVSASDGAQTMRVSTTTVEGRPALNLTDDRTHDGRWVSVSTDWLRDAYGSVPNVAVIAHEDGSVYTEPVRIRDGQAVFWVREFSTNTVTFGGTLEITDDPATDGTSHAYTINDLSSASNVSVTLTGVLTTEWDNVSVNGVADGQTLDLSIAGNEDPTGPANGEPVVVFEGVGDSNRVTTSGDQVTGGSTASVNVGGIQTPTNVNVTFTGSESTTEDSLSVTSVGTGDTVNYTVGGNSDPRSESVTFTGVETTNSFTLSGNGVSGGTSEAVSVPGNQPPESVSVTFTGSKTTNSRTVTETSATSGTSTSFTVGGNTDPQSEQITFTGITQTAGYNPSSTGVGPSSSQSISIDGNLEPTGPENGEPRLTLTVNQPDSYTENPSDGHTDYYGNFPFVGETSFGAADAEVKFTPEETGYIDSLYVNITHTTSYEGGTYQPKVDIFLSSGAVDGSISQDQTVSTSVEPAISQEGYVKFPLENRVKVEKGQIYHFEINTLNKDSTNNGNHVDIVTGDNYNTQNTIHSGNDEFRDAAPDIKVNMSPTSQVSVSDGSGNTVDFGEIEGQTTVSKAIDLDTSSNKLDWSTSGSADSLDWSLDVTDRTATEDPAVDLDGDGAVEVSYDGILKEGQTATKSVSSSTGSHTVETTLTAGSVDWDLTFTEVTGTQNPGIDVDGDGTDEASYNGVLLQGETATDSVATGELASGSTTFTFSGSGASFDYQIDGTAVTATEDPAIDLDGDGTVDISYDGVLTQGQTVTKSVSLSTGPHTAETTLTTGSVDWNVSWTEVTGAQNPGIDVDGDGTDEASYNGVLTQGESKTRNISDGELTTGESTLRFSGSGASYSYTLRATTISKTEDPSIDVDGDGAAEASVSGTIADNETVTRTLSNLSVSDDTATVNVTGSVNVVVQLRERTTTPNGSITINGNETSFGAVPAGSTTNLTINGSVLEAGQNNVTISLNTLSTDAPQPSVDLVYQHDLSARKNVLYEAEAFSERYNISRTFEQRRTNATLTIPHDGHVVSMRNLETRINESGGWTSVPESAASLDGTTLTIDLAALTGGEIPQGTTVEVRSTGSKVEVHNASITVVQATRVGFDLDTRVRLDEWNDDSYIGVEQTPQGTLVHYAANETYSDEGDYARIAGTEQRVYLPNAAGGAEVKLKTIPVEIETDGEVRVTVPEDSVNESRPVFGVSPGTDLGDQWSATYVGASEETYYGIYNATSPSTTTDRLDRVLGKTSLRIRGDDVGLVVIQEAAPPDDGEPSDLDDGGATLFGTIQQGNIVILSILFGGVAVLFASGRRPETSRNLIAGAADRLARLVERVPRVGGVVAPLVETTVVTLGDAFVTVGETEVLALGVAAAVGVGVLQAGLLTIGPETAALVAVGAVAVGSLIVLRRLEAFTTARWIAVVAVEAVIALQALGERDLLAALINSDVAILLVLPLGYAVVQLVREYRANNSPDDDRPQIVIDADTGSDGGD